MQPVFDGLAKIQADVAARAVELERVKAERRVRFPVAAELMEACASFNPTLKFAQQGDDTIGALKPRNWVDWFGLVSIKPRKRR